MFAIFDAHADAYRLADVVGSRVFKTQAGAKRWLESHQDGKDLVIRPLSCVDRFGAWINKSGHVRLNVPCPCPCPGTNNDPDCPHHSVIEYQLYGVNADGLVTHAGCRRFKALNAEVIRQDQAEWEAWATIRAAAYPDAPIKDSIGKTVKVIVYPVGKPEQQQVFVIGA
jgi:hypothetical protein